MARRRSVDRSARPDPTKAEVTLRWKVKIFPDGEVNVTNITTFPASDTSKMDIAGFCRDHNVRLVTGGYVLKFGAHSGMSLLERPSELDKESMTNLVTAFIPEFATKMSALSSEYARFPSDEEIREGAVEAVSMIFERLMRLENEDGKVPASIYSNIRPGFISVIGAECVVCMGLPGQKMPVGEVLHKYLAVYNSDGVCFGNGRAMFGFDTGKCVMKVGYSHYSHGFVFAKAVNEMLARRFAKILAEVEHEVITLNSKELHLYCVAALRVLGQVAGNYGFALSEPAQAPESVPTEEPQPAASPAPVAEPAPPAPEPVLETPSDDC